MHLFPRRFFRFPLAALALLIAEPLHAEVVDAPRKRGGFTGATPKPGRPKSTPSERTPAPTQRPKAREVDLPEEKKTESSESPKKLPKASEAGEGTPAPKKKGKQSDESTPVEKQAEKPDATATLPKNPATPELITPPVKPERAPAATLEPDDLAEFAALAPRTQALITAALSLTKLNLTYTYGSDDPGRGGMDCSGTMAYVLRAQGFKDVPRDSSSQYVWARKGGPFFAVVSKSAESFEFKDLQPGDLLFWTGTYETGREIPISHVMLYLGMEKKTKKRVMFGASDGRSYAGIQRWGVSVFDFKMPNGTAANGERTKVDFVGYGRIPGLREIPTTEPIAEKPPATPAPVVSSAATPKPRSSTKPATSSSGTRKKKRSE